MPASNQNAVLEYASPPSPRIPVQAWYALASVLSFPVFEYFSNNHFELVPAGYFEHTLRGALAFAWHFGSTSFFPLAGIVYGTTATFKSVRNRSRLGVVICLLAALIACSEIAVLLLPTYR